MSDPSVQNRQTRGLETLDRLTRFASEDLARGLNRRSFLRRTGAGAFAFMITLTSGKLLSPRGAAAAGPGTKSGPPLVPSCAPPGPYCNYQGGSPPQPNSCHGAHCFQHMSGGQIRQCHVYYAFYPSGCWTTAASGGYWT